MFLFALLLGWCGEAEESATTKAHVIRPLAAIIAQSPRAVIQLCRLLLLLLLLSLLIVY